MRNIGITLALLVSLALNSPAGAATSALVGNSYESMSDVVQCTDTYYCTLSFPAIPAGKIIRVNRVQCRVSAQRGPIWMYYGPSPIAGDYNGTKKTYFEMMTSTYTSSSYYYSFQSIPEIHIGAGRFPTVFYQTDTSVPLIMMECALTGIAV